jgi:hypothetical protein
MDAVALVSTVPAAWVRVVLVRLLVAVSAVPMVLLMSVLHRRMTSAGVCVHAATLGIPLDVSGLRQFLVLTDRSTVLFRHRCRLMQGGMLSRA